MTRCTTRTRDLRAPRLAALCFAALLVPSAPAFARQPASEPPASLRLIDVTGDGLLDRLELSADGELHVAVNLGGRVFDAIAQQLPSTPVADILVGDLDDDGRTDLYIVSPAENLALTGDGTGRFVDATERLGLADGGQGVRAQRLDLDGDGFDDLLLRNATHDVIFWRVPGLGFERSADTPEDPADEGEPTQPGGPASPGKPGGPGGASGPGAAGGIDAGGPGAGGPTADGGAGPIDPPSDLPPGVQFLVPPSQSPTVGSGGPGTLKLDPRVSGARRDVGSVGPASTPVLPASLVAILDAKYVNDDEFEVDGEDIADGVLTGPDVSTYYGDVIHMGGKVGIGTPTPQSKQSISGLGDGERLLGFAEGSDDSLFFESGFAYSGGDNRVHLSSTIRNQALGNPVMTWLRNGTVGVGVESPQYKFQVQGAGAGIVQSDSASGVSVGTSIDVGGGYVGTLSNHRLSFFTNSQYPGATLLQNGNFGVGTISPQYKLQVVGFTHGLVHSDPGTGVSLGTYIDGGGGYFGTISNHRLSFFTNSQYPAATLLPNGNFGIGTINPEKKLHVVGTARVGVLEITGGADMVESFDSVEDLEPGTVVVLDAERPGEVIASTTAYDRCVAGVVSGAGGVRPGLSLVQEGVVEGDVPLAMTGRVYVKCSAENGAIRPGDRLTTASLIGHAMRVSDETRAPGAVIGKAMSNLDDGTGLVLVLVNLQ